MSDLRQASIMLLKEFMSLFGSDRFPPSHYQYDSLGRAVATWRDEQASKGERFNYDAASHLGTVVYNADQGQLGVSPQD